MPAAESDCALPPEFSEFLKTLRDAFGRLIVDPDSLGMPERVAALRRLASQLQAGHSMEAAWLGRSLVSWFRRGGTLEEVLGVRAPRGSHRTPQAILLAEQRAQALVRLAGALGADDLALSVLRGEVECPPERAEMLADARELGCPTSKSAITRARKLLASRHGR